jgi:hypothetical protein
VQLGRAKTRRFLPTFGLLCGCLGADAAELDIAGNYGNEAGCRFAATKDMSSEDLLLLTPETVSTYATLCEFVQAVPARSGALIVTALCGHEGEIEESIDMLRIQKADEGEDAYRIFGQDGTLWGQVSRCP